jgi:DNA-binding GntR family transcriptional regulator
MGRIFHSGQSLKEWGRKNDVRRKRGGGTIVHSSDERFYVHNFEVSRLILLRPKEINIKVLAVSVMEHSKQIVA